MTLAVGDEIVDGRILDTNSRLVASSLIGTSARLVRLAHLQLPDAVPEIVAGLQWALAQKPDVILVSGGLGPTRDDLTREAVAQVSNVPLEWNEPAWQNVTQAFSMRGISSIPQANRQQALLPKNSVLLENRLGTAPGFAIPVSRAGHTTWIACLPGVPVEYEAMLHESLCPLLVREGLCQTQTPKDGLNDVFLFSGLGESAFETLVTEQIPSEAFESYAICARDGILELKVTWQSKRERDAHGPTLRSLIAPHLLSESIEPLPLQTHRALTRARKTIAFVETATSGLLSHQFAAMAPETSLNSLATFLGGWVQGPSTGSITPADIPESVEFNANPLALLKHVSELLRWDNSEARTEGTAESKAENFCNFASADLILITLGTPPARWKWDGHMEHCQNLLLSKQRITNPAEALGKEKLFQNSMRLFPLNTESSSLFSRWGFESLLTWSSFTRAGPATSARAQTVGQEACRRLASGSLAGLLLALQKGFEP